MLVRKSERAGDKPTVLDAREFDGADVAGLLSWLDSQRCSDVRFVLRPVASAFGGSTFRWEFPELKLANRIDAIAYQGEAKEHKLAAVGDAFVAFTLEEWPYDQRDMPAAVIETALADGKFRARWITRGKSLDIEAPVKPASYAAMDDALRSAVI